MSGVEPGSRCRTRARRWPPGALLAAIALAGPGCATTLDPQAATAAVPYRVDNAGRMIVDVMLDGEGPFAFMLDTGASISGLSEELRRRLALTVERNDVLIHGLTASGRRPVARVAELALGGARWNDVRVAILPDDHSASEDDSGVTIAPDGILGGDLLADYAAAFVTQDRVLRLFRPETVSAARYVGWRSIALEPGAERTPAARMLFFELEIEGQQARALFDLGAGFNVVNWATARQLGLTPQRYARRAEELRGVFEPLPRVPQFIARHTQTGQVSWQNEVFSVADLRIFSTLALGERPAAIIGAGLFAQRDFLIDFRRSRILVRVDADERSTY